MLRWLLLLCFIVAGGHGKCWNFGANASSHNDGASGPPTYDDGYVAISLSGFVRTTELVIETLEAFVISGDPKIHTFWHVYASAADEMDQRALARINASASTRRLVVEPSEAWHALLSRDFAARGISVAAPQTGPQGSNKPRLGRHSPFYSQWRKVGLAHALVAAHEREAGIR